jgi:TRAP transporter TAXI family solute receptor
MVEREIERAVSLNIAVLPIITDKTTPSLGMEFLISSIQWFHTSNQKPKNYIDELSENIYSIINQEKFSRRVPKKIKGFYALIFVGLSIITTFGVYHLNDEVSSSKECPKTYKIGTASIVGNYYRVAENLRRVNQDTCIQFELIQTKGSLDNAMKLIEEKIDIGLAQMDALQINKNINKNIAVLAQIYHEELHIIVRKDSKIKGFSDLKKRQISAGEKKSGSSITGNYLYEEYFKEQMIRPKQTQLSEALDNLRDRDIDAIITVVGSPAVAFNKRKMDSFKLVPFDVNLTEGMSNKYEKTTIKYSWMVKEVKTLSTKTLLIAKENHKSDERLKEFVRRLNGEYREKLMATATDDLNTPLMKWYDTISKSTLPSDLKYHSTVQSLYLKD